jgi:hypothetical protein
VAKPSGAHHSSSPAVVVHSSQTSSAYDEAVAQTSVRHDSLWPPHKGRPPQQEPREIVLRAAMTQLGIVRSSQLRGFLREQFLGHSRVLGHSRFVTRRLRFGRGVRRLRLVVGSGELPNEALVWLGRGE